MTTPPAAAGPQRRHRGAFAVTVASAAAVAGTPLINGPARLLGWSLQAGAQTANGIGSVTSPGANATIAATSTLPVGRYRVTVVVSLAGTLAQGVDAGNIKVQVAGGGQLIQLDNSIAAGDQTFGPFDMEVTTAGGEAIAVQAVGAGTVGSIYTAQISVNQNAQGTITDGAQVLGVIAAVAGSPSTQWLGEDGIYVGTDVQVRIAQGDVSGCIWVRKPDDRI